MAGIGLRKPYVGVYKYENSAIAYTKGQLLAKAVEFSASIENNDDNNLHADDEIAETDNTFAGGELTITTDDLLPDASALILGIEPKDITVGEETYQELVYDDKAITPDMGFGIIIPKMKDGIRKYRTVFFHKIKFNIPEDAATTEGESIEWQTPEISAVIMRDDTENRGWKSEILANSEADAVAYIEQKLQITNP